MPTMEINKLHLLTEGLKSGFAGETQSLQVNRGSFVLKSSHLENSEGEYHDEWIADRVGGGQEIIKVGDSQFTRLYAGGTIAIEELSRLEITKKDVMKYLISQINKMGNKTRLFEDCVSQDGDWSYQYQLIDSEDDIPVFMGKETINYKDTKVFVHNFLLCPIE